VWVRAREKGKNKEKHVKWGNVPDNLVAGSQSPYASAFFINVTASPVS
jgi:hypothetical protein